MIKKGSYVKVEVKYPRNKKLNGIFEGNVIETGCFRNGYAYFKLDTHKKLALPNSQKYVKVIEERRVG